MATSRLDQLPNSHHRAYNNPDTDWANNFSTRDNFSRERTSSTPPNVRLLREINRRAKVAEKSLVYVKIVGFVHLLLGLAILSVEWAKLLLVWAYLNSAEKKLSLVLRVCYPLYIVAIGTLWTIFPYDFPNCSDKFCKDILRRATQSTNLLCSTSWIEVILEN